MLTCKKHGKYIDDLNRVDEYPEELLVEFKKEHEKRICILTDIVQDAQTRVVLVQAPIDSGDCKINETQAHEALLPLYPADEHAELFDLSAIRLPSDAPGFYPALRESLAGMTRDLLRRRGAEKVRSLAVFAIAPIPLLVDFGYMLGDRQSVELFQRHRNQRPNPWSWKHEEELRPFYDTVLPELPDVDEREGAGPSTATPVISISISGLVDSDLIARHLEGPTALYQINLEGIAESEASGRDALRSRARLESFSIEFRRVLDVIRRQHGHERTIHLFAAVPAPVAIEIGRNVKHVDPPMLVYDFQKKTRGYVPALTINEENHDG